MKKALFVVVLIAVMGMQSVPALANPSQDGYSSFPVHQSDTLPFTGIGLLFWFCLGIILWAVGYSLYKSNEANS